MDYGDYVTYYFGLFTVQVTLATIIAAGILAWYQLSEKQIPKRNIGKVIKTWTLILYFLASVALAIFTGLMAWSLLGEHDIFPKYEIGITQFSVKPMVTLFGILITIAMVLFFFYILWKTKDLIDVKRYLQTISDDMDYRQFSDFLFQQYSYKPSGHIQLAWIGEKRTKKQKAEDEQQKQKAEHQIAEWEKRYEKTKDTLNPVDPIIEYCRANALSASSDVERIGLPLLSEILTKAAGEEKHQNNYVVKYIDDVTNDMLEVLGDSPIMVKKAFIDVLYDVASKYSDAGKYGIMVEVAKKLHKFTRGADNESLKMYAISKLDKLVVSFKEQTKDSKDWREVYLPMEGLILIGARIGEDYFHNIQDLAPVAIIENNNGENDDFIGALGNFMYQISDMHRKYTDAIPVSYFDSLYVVSLALQSAIARSSSIKQNLGLTRSKYEQAVTGWDYTFSDHARTAIEAKNKDLLSAAIYNFLKLVDNMARLELYDAMLDSIDTLIELGARIATNEWAKNKTTYGGVAIIDEVVNKIVSYPNQDALYERKSSIEHGLFDIRFKDGYADFMSRIGW